MGIEIAIKGLNREKEMLTTELIILARKGQFVAQIEIIKRLEKIDQEIKELLRLNNAYEHKDKTRIV